MPPLTPKQSVGYISPALSMRVVICPTCKRKRWANQMKDPHEVRSTCHGVVIRV